MNYVKRSNSNKNVATLKRYRLVDAPKSSSYPDDRINDIINKIIASKDQKKFIILYVNGCNPSANAIKYVRDYPHETFEISEIRQKLFEKLNQNANEIGFNSSHTTVPVVFYDGAYVGGNSELIRMKIN